MAPPPHFTAVGLAHSLYQHEGFVKTARHCLKVFGIRLNILQPTSCMAVYKTIKVRYFFAEEFLTAHLQTTPTLAKAPAEIVASFVIPSSSCIPSPAVRNNCCSI